MEKICYLHLGLPKTGTSSLQESFFLVRDILEEKFNIHYYRQQINGVDDPANIAITIYKAMKYLSPKTPSVFDGLIDLTDGKQHFAYLDHILKTKTKIILSSEVLSREKEDFLLLLKKTIQEYGFTTKMVLYVRNPYDHLSSNFQQMTKAAGINDGYNSFNNLHKDFYLPMKINNIFNDNLEIRRFEKQYLKNGDLFDDFCTFLKISEIAAILPKIRTNESLSIDATIIGYCMLKNNFPINKDKKLLYDPVHNFMLNKIHEQTLSKDKFIVPASLLKDEKLSSSITKYIEFLEAYFEEKNFYQKKDYPKYDIGSLYTIDEKKLLEIIHKAYQDNYNLSRDYHLHTQEITRLNKEWGKLNDALKEFQDTTTQASFMYILKAIFSKRKRERLQQIGK